ncbi:MAG: hypothetical protein IT353_13020 [Gemmatimonadaceae bacterium]|nr:hypothetical protein [Gemmatimonadaceae bacterium]
MIRTTVRSPLVGLLALTMSAAPAVAWAQITEVGRTPVADVSELTFGYRCDDRFVIRNDGGRAVDLAYGIEKGTEHIPVTLGPRELIELESKSKDALELWMGGKLIAKAEKEKRSCKDVAGTASVLVAPLEIVVNEPQRRSNASFWGPAYFDPWMYGYYGYYGGLGYRPFYRGFVGVPIVIGGRTGVRRGR